MGTAKVKFKKAQLEALCNPIFEDATNTFGVLMTKIGTPAIIFTKQAGGDYPIAGMYWNGGEWMPTKWCADGRWPSLKDTCELDLDIESASYE